MRCVFDSRWTKTEDGIVHAVDYLHEMAATAPYKAQSYLGRPISFSAPLVAVEENVRLEYYGHFDKLLILSAFDGKEFVVQDSGASAEYYAKGTLLRVSGKITALDKGRILLLDSAGTPGWPNVIKIEKLK